MVQALLADQQSGSSNPDMLASASLQDLSHGQMTHFPRNRHQFEQFSTCNLMHSVQYLR
jgi:hypothetical protein